MGVSGSGKTTMGRRLSDICTLPFYDGDDFHPKANIEKMSMGIPLNDKDRERWLSNLNQLAKENQSKNKSILIGCSALKEKYRALLSDGLKETSWIFLNGNYNTIEHRMELRTDHFMPPGLLNSQFESLEAPNYGLQVDINLTPEEIIDFILLNMEFKKEFGLIGLGVMGKSLARNLAGKGFKLALFNRFVAGKEEAIAQKFKNEFEVFENASAHENLSDFVQMLDQPRKVFLMVNAGKTVDLVIEELIPLLAQEDIIIDGGNSHYSDTTRRINYLKSKGLHFIGTGVSGGELGALNGPSIMPGGDKLAYSLISPYLNAIAAKDKDGNPCCTFIGQEGAGHFVKMVHNGIEYAEMQLLAEVYALMRFGLNYTPEEISEELVSWENMGLSSYLLEITHKLLLRKENNTWFIDQILDSAGNKGTGSWTTETMAAIGIPATLISTALFARFISSFYSKRKEYQTKFNLKTSKISIVIQQIREAYRLARLVNHQQGFELINEFSKENKWEINLSELARIWTNGCIIRSELMETLTVQLRNGINFLLNIPQEEMDENLKYLQKVCSEGILAGISMPCLLSAVDYLNAHIYNFPTANIIQAQRDFFGAHTYKLLNDPEGPSHHTIWE